jgi:uncharacterized protein YjbJ (UPF0337 family)
MNKDEAKGQQGDLKGRAKEAAGALSGDKTFQAEGTVERAAGATREGVGEVEEAVKRKVDEQKEEKAKEDE